MAEATTVSLTVESSLDAPELTPENVISGLVTEPATADGKPAEPVNGASSADKTEQSSAGKVDREAELQNGEVTKKKSASEPKASEKSSSVQEASDSVDELEPPKLERMPTESEQAQAKSEAEIAKKLEADATVDGINSEPGTAKDKLEQEPQASSSETKAGQVKKEDKNSKKEDPQPSGSEQASGEPAPKSQKKSEEPRKQQPTRRSKRKKFLGWGGKRKSRRIASQ